MADSLGMKLWIGPSGWSYDDWFGLVYPQPKPTGFDSLAYVSRYFDTVEVNSTFYRIPSSRMTADWPERVPEEFRFAVKLNQDFTHRRGAFPGRQQVDAFHEALRPLREAGVLGPLLMQFPWSFRYNAENVDWLKRLAEVFPEYDRFIEVRHATWSAAEALADLREAGGYCNIDQPALRDCLGPTQHIFGSSAYVRLHGRNARNWFADNVPSYERYNYLYGDDELREWVQRIVALGEEARDVYVYANNHYQGQGPVNALQLKALITGEPVDAPATLVQQYPQLAPFARPTGQGQLF